MSKSGQMHLVFVTFRLKERSLAELNTVCTILSLSTMADVPAPDLAMNVDLQPKSLSSSLLVLRHSLEPQVCGVGKVLLAAKDFPFVPPRFFAALLDVYPAGALANILNAEHVPMLKI